MFQRVFVRLTDSITGALFLSQAVYWQNRCTSEDGWWYKTAQEWEEDTGMSRRELETARRAAEKYLRFEVRGLPARTYYRVDGDALDSDISLVYEQNQQFGGKGQTGLAERDKHSWRKGTNTLGGKGHSTNNINVTENNALAIARVPSPLRQFTDLWMTEYEKQFRSKYLFQKAVDGTAAARLVKVDQPENLIYLVLRAWRAPADRDHWNCNNQSATIATFAAALNKIRAELRPREQPMQNGF